MAVLCGQNVDIFGQKYKVKQLLYVYFICVFSGVQIVHMLVDFSAVQWMSKHTFSPLNFRKLY